MSSVEVHRAGAYRGAGPGLIPGPHGLHRGRSVAWWGMVGVIVTEALFFTVLLTSYWYIRFQHGPTWPPFGIQKPPLLLVGIMTPVLILSSAPMHWAEAGIRKGRLGQLKLGLVVTFVMGATFVALQSTEYVDTLREFTPRSNVYGTLFFTITGFHGIHVVAGLVMNLWLQYYAWRRVFTADIRFAVENVVMYWHFVDAVWVFILASLYLAPHVWP